jgi:hypothetical protein
LGGSSARSSSPASNDEGTGDPERDPVGEILAIALRTAVDAAWPMFLRA